MASVLGSGASGLGSNPGREHVHPIQGGVEIFMVASCYRNRDKLRPDVLLGWYADLTFFAIFRSLTVFRVIKMTRILRLMILSILYQVVEPQSTTRWGRLLCQEVTLHVT